MARAHFVTYALDSEGRPIPGCTVVVREPDTETAISETIFAEDDPDVTELSNPFTADADGKVEIWLENPKVVDLFITKTGFDPSTIRAVAHQLTASTLTVKEAGTPLAQRAGLNFLDGFDLTDDAASDETEVAIDLTELTAFTDHKARHQNGGADEITIAGLEGTSVELQAHLDDAADAHDASAISIADAGGDFTATTVEGALDELQADAEADAAALAAHIADGTDAHDASAISIVDAGGNFTATEVEAALAEEADARQAHEADAADAHDASAISIVDAGGNFAATNVEDALAEEADARQAHEASEVFVRKTADETVNNSDSVQADNELLFAAGADEVWEVEAVIIYQSSTNADFQWDFGGAAAEAAGVWHELQQGGASVNDDRVNASAIIPSSLAGGLGAGVSVGLHIRGIVVKDGTPGDITFRWAQRAAEVSNTIVKQNSFLIARKRA